jgi:hypothetical protein
MGVGIGAGAALGQQMAGAMAAGGQPHPAPPPLPTAAQFHVAINGQQAGPFDLAGLQAKVKEGAVTRASLVWKPGMTQWAAADSVPELASLFASVPPPLPK